MHPTEIAVIGCLAVMLSTSIIQWTFLIRLKRVHTEQWHHAGCPTIMTDQSFTSAYGTISYLQSADYLTSGSSSGISFCKKFRYPMVVGYWFTAIVFINAITVGFINGWPPHW